MKGIDAGCQNKRGFTLVELITILAVIGILAAVAFPSFSNLMPNAQQSSVQGLAGALGAASASNYGQRMANSSAGSAVHNCTDVGALMTGGLPSGYTITSAAIASGAQITCTLSSTSNNTIQAAFVGMGIN